jgi:hypothetical protein
LFRVIVNPLPRDLRALLDSAREVNPVPAPVRARVMARARAALQAHAERLAASDPAASTPLKSAAGRAQRG